MDRWREERKERRVDIWKGGREGWMDGTVRGRWFCQRMTVVGKGILGKPGKTVVKWFLYLVHVYFLVLCDS